MFNCNHDFPYITLKDTCSKVYLTIDFGGKLSMPQVSRQAASDIVIDFLKKQKNTDKIDVAMVEEQSDGWMVRGTCPIDLEGHQWAERFAVVVDLKGKIRTTDFALL